MDNNTQSAYAETSGSRDSTDQKTPLHIRYATKINVDAIYGATVNVLKTIRLCNRYFMEMQPVYYPILVRSTNAAIQDLFVAIGDGNDTHKEVYLAAEQLRGSLNRLISTTMSAYLSIDRGQLQRELSSQLMSFTFAIACDVHSLFSVIDEIHSDKIAL